MIPKKIHYCWFGGNPKSDLINLCISSWKENLPDYEIIEWNESNFDFEISKYLKSAYEAKKWAFVSDYVRAYALYNHGGIYLDTDVEIKLNLDEFLKHGAFSGFETKGFPFTALWGCEKLHPWPKKIINYYNVQENFTQIPNTQIVSDILVNDYKIDKTKDETQILADHIVIYPSSHFCLDLPLNYATHHFSGSWLENKQELYKDKVHKIFSKEQLYTRYKDNYEILDQLRIDGVISIRSLIAYLFRKIKNRIS